MNESYSLASSGLIVVGSITADVTTFSARLPQRGETVLGDDVSLVLGGKGANQAVAGAKAGVSTHLVGCVGNDLFKGLVLDGLRAHGVGLSEVRIVGDRTGVAHIRVDAAGDNDIVIVPLANSHLSFEQVDSALAELAGRCSVLVTQLEVPPEVAVHALRSARALGLTTILDPAPAISMDADVWSSVDIVTPNESEASLISGVPVTDFPSAIEAGRWFCARGVKYAVVTLASAGAVLVTSTSETQFESFAVESLDSTAAGDAFTGYLGAGLASGLDLNAAITHAMAAGALTVTKRGASSSLPSRTDVAEFLAARKTRDSVETS